jgi:hypothetical protein
LEKGRIVEGLVNSALNLEFNYVDTGEPPRGFNDMSNVIMFFTEFILAELIRRDWREQDFCNMADNSLKAIG